ncbi:MAG: YbhB/YbcL family Raf kinase inhibitor-like protein [Ilumatobacteraceae bacterium]
MRNARPLLVLAACSVTMFVACNDDGRTLREPGPDQTASVYTTTTTSTVPGDVVADPGSLSGIDPALDTPALAFVLNLPWQDGGAIDPRYTCDGADIQPGVSWLGAPADAVEMAIVVTDTDADNFVHWVIAGLDPTDPFIGENSVPVGAIEAINDFGSAAVPAATTTSIESGTAATATTLVNADEANIGWRGPCPPAGAPHHYLFSLYALGEHLQLPTGSSAADLQAAIDAVALSVTHRTGVYPGN